MQVLDANLYSDVGKIAHGHQHSLASLRMHSLTHLKAVDPVVVGMTRAKQHNIGSDMARRKVRRLP